MPTEPLLSLTDAIAEGYVYRAGYQKNGAMHEGVWYWCSDGEAYGTSAGRYASAEEARLKEQIPSWPYFRGGSLRTIVIDGKIRTDRGPAVDVQQPGRPLKEILASALVYRGDYDKAARFELAPDAPESVAAPEAASSGKNTEDAHLEAALAEGLLYYGYNRTTGRKKWYWCSDGIEYRRQPRDFVHEHAELRRQIPSWPMTPERVVRLVTPSGAIRVPEGHPRVTPGHPLAWVLDPPRSPTAVSDAGVLGLSPPVDDGQKFDGEKEIRPELLPVEALELVSKVFAYGARKYEANGWRKVRGWRRRYYGAAFRHLFAWWLNERNDPESGLPHLAHAATCVLILLTQDETPGVHHTFAYDEPEKR